MSTDNMVHQNAPYKNGKYSFVKALGLLASSGFLCTITITQGASVIALLYIYKSGILSKKIITYIEDLHNQQSYNPLIKILYPNRFLVADSLQNSLIKKAIPVSVMVFFCFFLMFLALAVHSRSKIQTRTEQFKGEISPRTPHIPKTAAEKYEFWAYVGSFFMGTAFTAIMIIGALSILTVLLDQPSSCDKVFEIISGMKPNEYRTNPLYMILHKLFCLTFKEDITRVNTPIRQASQIAVGITGVLCILAIIGVIYTYRKSTCCLDEPENPSSVSSRTSICDSFSTGGYEDPSYQQL